MATITSKQSQTSLGHHGGEISDTLMQVLKYIGSLKLTVALLALSMVIVLVGSLAQDELNMQQVKDRYFTCWIAKVFVDDFVPNTMYFHTHRFGANAWMPDGIWFPFPGGALIGTMLLANLIAAKITRFHIKARGVRLALGAAVFGFGLAVLAAIVFKASATEGLQGQPPSYRLVWNGLCAFVGLGLLGTVLGAFIGPRKGWRIIFAVVSLAFAIAGVAILSGFTIGEPGLRIVWQLAKGLGVASILLVGCLLLFGRQGGNLLLHFGVALLMIGQFAFGDHQLEQRLILAQRESSNTLVNIDQIELAFIDRSDADQTNVVSIPSSLLRQYSGSKQRIQNAQLPVDVEVVQYMVNSTLVEGLDDNPATEGLGLKIKVADASPHGGTSEEVNIASAYVRFYEKDQPKPLGTYLITQWLNDAEKLSSVTPRNDEFDSISSNGKSYDVGLRMQRVPKPYWIQLSEVRRINYSGTETPRDYSSFVRIINPETGEDRTERIWMNNPLRYQGETFYQSGYNEGPGGRKSTILQVVRNDGWLIPYVACGIVGLGMLVHFVGTLDRFLGRRERESRSATTGKVFSGQMIGTIVICGLIVLCEVFSIGMPATFWNRFNRDGDMKRMDMYRAGEIPIHSGGRLMPLDQFARESLKTISNKDQLSTKDAPASLVARVGKSMSAMEWFFETIGDDQEILDFPLFRIDADEVLSEVGLTKRPLHRYSFRELSPSFTKIQEQSKAARAKDAGQLSFKESGMVQLHGRLNQFVLLKQVFRQPLRVDDLRQEDIPEGMTLAQVRTAVMQMNVAQIREVMSSSAPMIFPPTKSESATEIEGEQPEWKMYGPAALEAYAIELDGKTADIPGLESFDRMRKAYHDNDAQGFNESLTDMIASVQAAGPSDLHPKLIAVERWLVGSNIFYMIFSLYVVAILFSLTCLMVELPQLRRSTFMLLVTACLLHSVVIVLRMYVSGRAPVINLYSSAVFIAWAGVFAGILVEIIYRHGIGSLVAAISGVTGAMVAWGLNTGDTMPVLQAVLDTQFWLSTHVVTITLGYAATFLAGIMGILYLCFSGNLSSRLLSFRHDLYRMIYGVCCFGILFSFVGTVLGGLWADDSWGRFWGWDPKENGALLIVIWNAVMLHARWDGMVGPRGFATLAVFGNIVTAWSWFGTNQIGFGLHSYGGQDSVKKALLMFAASQLVFVVLGVCGSLTNRIQRSEPTQR